MTEPSLGLLMIVRNEAHNLQRSLLPVMDCFDEVVVVDSGSSDATKAMAADAGAKVFDFTWCHDFAAARNFSISCAESDWLFWLDGDNAIEPEQVDLLREMIPQSPAVLWALEKVVPGGSQLWQKRCFPRLTEVSFQGRVHEQLVHPPQWPGVVTPLVVKHWGYADPKRNREKGLYYLDLLKGSLEDNPGDFYTHFQMGRCYHNLREMDLAATHFDYVIQDHKARATNPQIWAAAHYMAAQVLGSQGKGRQAASLLDGLIQASKGQGLPHYHRGRLAYDHGDYELAESHLAQALNLGLEAPVIDLDPSKTLFFAYYFRGRALANLGRSQEAADEMTRALAIQPGNQAARTELGRLLMSLGQTGPATEHLREVLRFNPNHRMVKGLLAQAGA